MKEKKNLFTTKQTFIYKEVFKFKITRKYSNIELQKKILKL